jgi:YVTN family beta-propeller protein
MSFRNKGWMAATVLALVICVACGQIYRPVVIPINNIPPSPADFHAVFSLNTNAFYGLDQNPANPSIPPLIPTLLYGPGSAMQIDVGGDTDLGIASLVDGTVSGANPTHGVSLPNFSRVFVASAGSAIADGLDAISSFVPVTQSATSSGIGAATVVSYPNLIPNPGALPPAQPNFFCSYLPDFVAASQNTTVYVANYGVENAPPVCNPNGTTSTDSITVVNGTSNVITNIIYAAPASTPPIVLSNPVALAQVQTLNGNKLYVANQGNNTVASFYTVDMAPTTATGTVSGFSGTTPVWIVARGDGQQVYVVSQGDGQLWTIDAATDAVIGSVSVGVGANYVLYDPNLNRLYVTNPNNSSAYIFSVAGSLPSLLKTISVLCESLSHVGGGSARWHGSVYRELSTDRRGLHGPRSAVTERAVRVLRDRFGDRDGRAIDDRDEHDFGFPERDDVCPRGGKLPPGECAGPLQSGSGPGAQYLRQSFCGTLPRIRGCGGRQQPRLRQRLRCRVRGHHQHDRQQHQ